ncbi:MAG: FHA domain-containing protein [Phycisphaerales bacterium JB037]
MNVSLVLIKKDGSTAEAPIRSGSATIGRDVGCQVRIPVPDVSRRHCAIIQANGKLKVKDLGSSNGTFVNDKRVEEAELHAGDLLVLGEQRFMVRIDGQPKEIPFAAGGSPAATADDEDRDDITESILAELGDVSDGTSVSDFDFDLSDDDDEQPKL